MIISDSIDMMDTMYPSTGEKLCDVLYEAKPYSTLYGYVLEGQLCLPSGIVYAGEYFCFWTGASSEIKVIGCAVIFTRFGFKGQNMIGGPLEKSGRLCYIDGCSDSLLVYPPRQGDASLNALYFPPGVEQTFHIHPSIRLGVVVGGSGIACTPNGNKDLTVGTMFCIEERERHRFMTEDESMIVLAFHPDGDWGPTDHNHTMLNRTYITKKE
jgi:quercetin dioxygenase-like cupin family protein